MWLFMGRRRDGTSKRHSSVPHDHDKIAALQRQPRQRHRGSAGTGQQRGAAHDRRLLQANGSIDSETDATHKAREDERHGGQATR